MIASDTAKGDARFNNRIDAPADVLALLQLRCLALQRGHLPRSAIIKVPNWSSRRFPPAWTVEDIGAAFVVNDSSGQKLAYIYYEEEPGRRSAAKLLS